MHVRAIVLLVVLLLAILALAYSRPGFDLDTPEGYTLVVRMEDARVYHSEAGCLYLLWSSDRVADIQSRAAALSTVAPFRSLSLSLHDLLTRLGLEGFATHPALPPLYRATVKEHYPALVTPHCLYARDILFHLPGGQTGRHGELFVFNTPSSRCRTVAVLYLASQPDLEPDLDLFEVLGGLRLRNVATPTPEPGIRLHRSMDVELGRPSSLPGSPYVSVQVWSRGPSQRQHKTEQQTAPATRRTANEVSWLVTVENCGTIGVSDVYLRLTGPAGPTDWFSHMPRLDIEPGAIAEFRLKTLVPRTVAGRRAADLVRKQTRLELAYTAHGQEYHLPVR